MFFKKPLSVILSIFVPWKKSQKFSTIKFDINYNPDFTDSIQNNRRFNTAQTRFKTSQIHKYLTNKSTNIKMQKMEI